MLVTLNQRNQIIAIVSSDFSKQWDKL